MSSQTRIFASLVCLVLATPVAFADTTCPASVKAAIDKAFPKATISTCKAEQENGRDQFEVRIVKTDGKKAEVDVSPDGKILQVEEVIPLDQLPAAVSKAFSAKYPKAKPTRAEKQTGKSVTYEIAFEDGGAKKEATFTEDGKLVEEE